MGRMKDLLITVHNGGEEAVAAVERIGKDWREQLEQAASEIERLRLTDEERKAIEYAELTLRCETHPVCEQHMEGLRRLLKRLA